MNTLQTGTLKRPFLSRSLRFLINTLTISSLSFASQAELYTVTDGGDISEYTNGSSNCGNPCTLRTAIRAANARPGADEIVISEGIHPYLTNGDSGSIDEDDGKLGDLDITDDLEILGESTTGRNIISAGGLGLGVDNRVFHIFNGAKVTFQNISIQHGNLSIETEQGSDGKNKIIGNPAGAGILIEAGSVVTLTNVEVSNNTISTSSVADFTTVGGGIYIADSATIIINDSEITNNKAPSGGGIANAGRADIRRTLIHANQATDDNDPDSRTSGGGGGINNQGGYLSLGSSTISDNTSTQLGGGIYFANQGQNNGNIIITNSVINKNFAEFGGAGISNFGPLSINNSAITENHSLSSTTPGSRGNGAGIFNSGLGSLDMVNSTISGNSGAHSGGGIFSSRDVSLTNVTIYNNEATPCTASVDCIENSQIGGNQIALFTSSSSRPNMVLSNTIIGNGPDSNLIEPPCAGSSGYTADIKSLGNNLESSYTDPSNTCGLAHSRDETSIADLRLATLDNDPERPTDEIDIGGQDRTLFAARQVNALLDATEETETEPAKPASPAIDNGNQSCPLVDQRFMIRDDNDCDIGAYEQGASQQQGGNNYVDLQATIADTPDPIGPKDEQQSLVYNIVVTNLYENTPANSVTITIDLPRSFEYSNISIAATGTTPACTVPNTNNTITCEARTIEGLGRVELFISGFPQVEGIITATVNVISGTADSFSQNNLNITEDTVVDVEASCTTNFGNCGTTTNSGTGGGAIHPLALLITALFVLGRHFRARTY